VPDSVRIRFGALPETGAEADAVSRLWREHRKPDADVAELVGPAATEEAFKRLAPGRRVLHLATHGFALGADAAAGPEGSRGIGGVGAGERPADERIAALVPGLALAGANAPASASRDDGFLTAEEITAMDLSSVEWAVLSACETGLSDPHAVEAVQGLHRAFRRAGARTVIMSLWAVDDAATGAWMRRLYQARLVDHASTAESVRAACREMLRERRAAGLDTHPFRWAAFVATGDWR
jgi:CHAT domain-containing protein